MFHIFHHPSIHPSPKVISAVIDIKSILSKRWRTASSFMCSRRLVTAPPETGNSRVAKWGDTNPKWWGPPNHQIVSLLWVFFSLFLGWSTYPHQKLSHDQLMSIKNRFALPSQSSRKLQQQELQPKVNIFAGGFGLRMKHSEYHEGMKLGF